MSNANQDIGKKNAKKLRDWLETKPSIPMYQGRVNKSKICRELGITYSTIQTNKLLLEEFMRLEESISDRPKEKVNSNNSETIKKLKNEISRLENRVAALQAENHELKKAKSTEHLFLESGRLVR